MKFEDIFGTNELKFIDKSTQSGNGHKCYLGIKKYQQYMKVSSIGGSARRTSDQIKF